MGPKITRQMRVVRFKGPQKRAIFELKTGFLRENPRSGPPALKPDATEEEREKPHRMAGKGRF